MAGRYRRKDTLYRTRQPVGERLLRELQLKAAGRVSEWEDLLLVEGGAGAGRTLAGSLQHHPSTLFARLQIASTRDVATRSENRVWRSGKQSTLPTSPHPRRRRDTYKNQCATLTIQPVQKIGHSNGRTQLSFPSHPKMLLPENIASNDKKTFLFCH